MSATGIAPPRDRSGPVTFRLLGPVTCARNGQPVELGRRRERCLLGLLLLEAGRIVPLDRLLSLLWGDDPPPAARRQLSSNVSRLRQRLAAAGSDPARIATRGNGYLVDVDPLTVDVHRFEYEVQRAGALPPAERAEALRDALALWRGPLMSDVLTDDLRERIGVRFEERRLAAIELLAEAELDCGRAGQITADLAELVERYPLRERLVGLQIRALYRDSRRPEALAAFQKLRRRLCDELGVEPSQELHELHRSMLRAEAPTDSVGDAPGRTEWVVPAQLPAATADFTGRRQDLQRLSALARTPDGSAAAVIVVVAGSPGVGKTALAVQWAHEVAHRYPDGQLFVNLRGYDNGEPVRPMDALAQFLRALGVPPERIPVAVDEAAALYRSVVADRRILVVLDNAASADQIRPLLPGGSDSLVVVSSRERLAGLAARNGARRLRLAVLPGAEAAALLGRMLGADRVATEPAAVVELTELCGHLPLALRITAARLADHPELLIADHVGTLREGNRLAALEIDGDHDVAVRAAFDQSYAALPPDAARMFRLVGLVPGPDFTAAAAAALAGTARTDAVRALDRLAAANLVEPYGKDRYTLHDLLRIYARERVAGEPDRPAATGRLHEYYLYSADRAATMLYPQMVRLPLAQPPATGQPETFADAHAATEWLDAERANLVAAVVDAAETGTRPVAWQLADVLRGYLYLGRHLGEWARTAEAGLAAATAGGDVTAQAACHSSLGLAALSRADYARAQEYYRHARRLSRQARWTDGEAAVLGHLGLIAVDLGQLPEAVEYYREALELKTRIGQPGGRATGLGNVGLVHLMQGQLDRAVDHLAAALALHRQAGTATGHVVTLSNLAEAYHLLGRSDEALAFLDEALVMAQRVHSVTAEVFTRNRLAVVHRDAGRHLEALEHATAAVRLTRDNGNPYATAEALNTLAGVHRCLTLFAEAVDGHTEALTLARQVGNRFPEAEALIGLGTVRRDRAEFEYAVAPVTEALAIARKVGYRVVEGRTLTLLAEIHLGAGDAAAAAADAREAIGILAETGAEPDRARATLVLGRAVAG